jgi:hypothetical protein
MEDTSATFVDLKKKNNFKARNSFEQAMMDSEPLIPDALLPYLTERNN